MHKVLQQIASLRILPVVRLDDIEFANPLMNALESSGLPMAEVTLRSECALDAISCMSNCDSFLVGAGTVLNRNQCQQAIQAGAAFVVSPGLDQGVVECCQEHSLPCFPGVATPSEIQRAIHWGLNTLKFFPAEAMGGVSVLEAFAGPFPGMQFIPTGGINPNNVNCYLNTPNVLAVGGSWMVSPKLYADGNFQPVKDAVRDALALRA